MKKLLLMSSIIKGLSAPLIRIYLRNNRLSLKILCFIVVSVDYQLVRYIIKNIVVVVSRKAQ